MVHATHPSVAQSLSTSPLNTNIFRLSDSPRICGMVREIQLLHQARVCLNHCTWLLELVYPSSSQTHKGLPFFQQHSFEASSFHDAFARHRKDASCPRMMLHITSLDRFEVPLRTQALVPTIASRSFFALPSMPSSPMRFLVGQFAPR